MGFSDDHATAPPVLEVQPAVFKDGTSKFLFWVGVESIQFRSASQGTSDLSVVLWCYSSSFGNALGSRRRRQISDRMLQLGSDGAVAHEKSRI